MYNNKVKKFLGKKKKYSVKHGSEEEKLLQPSFVTNLSDEELNNAGDIHTYENLPQVKSEHEDKELDKADLEAKEPSYAEIKHVAEEVKPQAVSSVKSNKSTSSSSGSSVKKVSFSDIALHEQQEAGASFPPTPHPKVEGKRTVKEWPTPADYHVKTTTRRLDTSGIKQEKTPEKQGSPSGESVEEAKNQESKQSLLTMAKENKTPARWESHRDSKKRYVKIVKNMDMAKELSKELKHRGLMSEYSTTSTDEGSDNMNNSSVVVEGGVDVKNSDVVTSQENQETTDCPQQMEDSSEDLMKFTSASEVNDLILKEIDSFLGSDEVSEEKVDF